MNQKYQLIIHEPKVSHLALYPGPQLVWGQGQDQVQVHHQVQVQVQDQDQVQVQVQVQEQDQVWGQDQV